MASKVKLSLNTLILDSNFAFAGVNKVHVSVEFEHLG